MSTCQHCLQRMCRRHPQQDHGARMNELQQMVKSKSSTNFDDLIKRQIEKLSAENAMSSIDDVLEYRSKLDAVRNIDTASGSISNKRGYSEMISGGLNPAVASIMLQEVDSSTDSDSESDKSNKKKRKRKEKDRKSGKSEKKDKKEKKEKRSKKEKKQKREKRSRSRKYSDNDSSSSGYDS